MTSTTRRNDMKTTIRLAMTSMLAAAVLLGATGALAATSYKYNVVLKPIPIKNSKGTRVIASGTAIDLAIDPEDIHVLRR